MVAVCWTIYEQTFLAGAGQGPHGDWSADRNDALEACFVGSSKAIELSE
jgi:hypothetical protein